MRNGGRAAGGELRPSGGACNLRNFYRCSTVQCCYPCPWPRRWAPAARTLDPWPGLAWLDATARRRVGGSFLAAIQWASSGHPVAWLFPSGFAWRGSLLGGSQSKALAWPPIAVCGTGRQRVTLGPWDFDPMAVPLSVHSNLATTLRLPVPDHDIPIQKGDHSRHCHHHTAPRPTVDKPAASFSPHLLVALYQRPPAQPRHRNVEGRLNGRLGDSRCRQPDVGLDSRPAPHASAPRA